MAFSIDCLIPGCECRGVESGTSKKGNPYRSIRVEDPTGHSAEVSCTRSELFGAVDALGKGDICDLSVRAVAGRERSYLSLLSEPVVSGNAYSADASYAGVGY